MAEQALNGNQIGPTLEQGQGGHLTAHSCTGTQRGSQFIEGVANVGGAIRWTGGFALDLQGTALVRNRATPRAGQPTGVAPLISWGSMSSSGVTSPPNHALTKG